jgi:protoporphyrinogen oxidase
MNERFIVVGASMSGIVSAYLLSRAGHAVTLVESKRAIGGVNSGLDWQGFSLDFGCHLFGNESDESTAVVLDLLGGAEQALPVDVRFASVINGRRTEGFELPALDSFGADVSAKILLELLRGSASGVAQPAPRSLAELLEQRYGATAASLLDRALFKQFRAHAGELAPEAVNATTFGRIKAVDDEVARLLKKLPALDARLAAGSQGDPMKYYRDRVKLYPHRSFYPAHGGMKGFVSSAGKRLAELGVRVLVDTELSALELGGSVRLQTTKHGSLEADSLLWTLGLGRLETLLGGESTIAAATQQVPMVLYYFAIPKSAETGYSYVNDFDPDNLVFRASVPGAYGRGNCPEGQSYVCCEVPSDPERDEWKEPERFAAQVWSEVLRLGVARGEPLAHRAIKTPVSYKAPRRELGEKSELLRARLAREKKLLLTDEWAFSTTRTVLEVQRMLRERSAA